MEKKKLIEQLESLRLSLEALGDDISKEDAEALRYALGILRGPTRGQVEAIQGSWEWLVKNEQKLLAEINPELRLLDTKYEFRFPGWCILVFRVHIREKGNRKLIERLTAPGYEENMRRRRGRDDYVIYLRKEVTL